MSDKDLICKIHWDGSDDVVMVDSKLGEYYQMLSKLVTVKTFFQTRHNWDYKTVTAMRFHFKFTEDMPLANKQAIKDMVYYHGREKFGVNLLQFHDHKNNQSEPYDFTIDVSIEHVLEVFYQGETFLPLQVMMQTKEVPTNTTIH